MPVRIASQVDPKIPNCFPTNKPTAIPTGIGLIKWFNVKPVKETPAFTNAKIGNTPKAIQGCKLYSNLRSGDRSIVGFLLSRTGIAQAIIIPANVALTPDSNTVI